MAAPSDTRWRSRPGGWDVIQAQRLLKGEPRYGIPEMLPVDLPAELPARFVPWPARKHRPASAGLHFFVDDYRFEGVWRSPDRYAPVLTRAPVVCGPDFSVLTGWPFAMVVWQVYRARWLARVLQELGAVIVPAVTWAEPRTFEVAFLGLPRGVPVAVSSVGRARHRAAWDLGFRRLVEAVEPRLALVHGPALDGDVDELVEVHRFDSDQQRRARAIDGR